MFEIVFIVASIMACIATVLFYIQSHFKTEGYALFRECYITMAVGYLAVLICAGLFVLSLESGTIEYSEPPRYRIWLFQSFIPFVFLVFSFMWLDLLRQYIKLRK